MMIHGTTTTNQIEIYLGSSKAVNGHNQLRTVRDQSKQFNKGRAKYKKKATPSNEQLVTYVNKKSRRK